MMLQVISDMMLTEGRSLCMTNYPPLLVSVISFPGGEEGLAD